MEDLKDQQPTPPTPPEPAAAPTAWGSPVPTDAPPTASVTHTLPATSSTFAPDAPQTAPPGHVHVPKSHPSVDRTAPPLEPSEPEPSDVVFGVPDSFRESTPDYVSRHVGVNQFQIIAYGQPCGRILSPEESGVVMSWLRSIQPAQ